MAIVYTELKNEVEAILRIDSVDADVFQIDESINQAQLHILNTADHRWLTDAVKTVLPDLVASTADMQWESDFLRYLEGWIDYENAITADNEGRKLNIYRPEDHVLPIGRLATKEWPFIDMALEGGFRVQPTPDANVTDGLRIRYVYKLPVISSSQNSLLDARFKNLMINYAVKLSAIVEDYDVELSREHGKMFEEGIRQYLPKDPK